MNNKNVCKVCGKPLQQQLCHKCHGTGRTNPVALLKRDCEYCGGSGFQYFCPNQSGHAKSLKKTPTITKQPIPLKPLNPIGHNATFNIGSDRCPICGGTGVVKPAWMGGVATCLRCNGTGRVGVSGIGNTFLPRAGRVCPLCHGTRGVPGPFGAPGPCPKCGGTGRIY